MSGRNKHSILVVDDEPEVLRSLRGLLRMEFNVFTAESGAEAVKGAVTFDGTAARTVGQVDLTAGRAATPP